jgi:hypothetical protein
VTAAKCLQSGVDPLEDAAAVELLFLFRVDQRGPVQAGAVREWCIVTTERGLIHVV